MSCVTRIYGAGAKPLRLEDCHTTFNPHGPHAGVAGNRSSLQAALGTSFIGVNLGHHSVKDVGANNPSATENQYPLKFSGSMTRFLQGVSLPDGPNDRQRRQITNAIGFAAKMLAGNPIAGGDAIFSMINPNFTLFP